MGGFNVSSRNSVIFLYPHLSPYKFSADSVIFLTLRQNGVNPSSSLTQSTWNASQAIKVTKIYSSLINLFGMHLVSCCPWHLYASWVSPPCKNTVSFQVTDSGYQPSWQMKNNSAGAISPTSDLCL